MRGKMMGHSLNKIANLKVSEKVGFRDPIFSYKLFSRRENILSIQIMKSLLNDFIHKVDKASFP